MGTTAVEIQTTLSINGNPKIECMNRNAIYSTDT